MELISRHVCGQALEGGDLIMGFYDHIHVPADDARFHCSRGHAITELQSKDFGQTMGDVHISGEAIEVTDGGWGRDKRPARPLNGRFLCYAFCTACPVFVTTGKVCKVVESWVEFEIDVVGGKVRAVRRVSQDYLQDAIGPLPRVQAGELQRAMRDSRSLSRRRSGAGRRRSRRS